ncbi:MAG: hypothetical protein JW860_14935 [Sedimentisphaerales bacterium]|nr:hypothetical protein [Sedimentisphaerales bacterium]
MMELAMIIASIIIMCKLADMEGRSSILWGVLTFVLCVVALNFLPYPMIRIGIALVASIILMMLVKIIQKDA